MSLATTDNRKDYVGDGSTVSFSLPYLVYDSSHVKVYVNGVLQTSGYTVSGVGSPTGIVVTFSTAPASGASVLLIRVVPTTQLTSYTVAGAFPAKTTEKDLDLQTMINQQQNEEFGRAIKIPITSTAKNVDFPDPANTSNHGKVVRIVNATTLDTVTIQPNDSFSPLTTKGDLATHDGTIQVRLPVGNDNALLVADSSQTTGLSWKPGVQSKGDVLTHTGTTYARLPVGNNDDVLTVDLNQPTGIAWKRPVSFLTAKGDLLTHDGTITVRLPVGSNGDVLTADSTQSTGLVWKKHDAATPFAGTIMSRVDTFGGASSKLRADLEYVVTNKGVYCNPARNLQLNLNLVGSAGGMQSVAVNSTWNKLYYIRKSSDGSEGLWGVRAHEYFQDEINNGNGSEVAQPLRSTSANQMLAQGFMVDNAGPIDMVNVVTVRTGSPGGYLWLEIRSDNGGVPSDTVLATSDKYVAANISNVQRRVLFLFRDPFTPTVGVQYHLVMRGDWTIDNTNYISWYANTSNTYSRGAFATYNGTSWTQDTSKDALFQLYTRANVVPLSPPTGYDQYAHIGWFYINSGGSIPYFYQINRTVYTATGSPDSQIVAATNIAETFTTNSVVFPPTPVVAAAEVYTIRSSNGGQCYVALGPVFCTNINYALQGNVSPMGQTTVGVEGQGVYVPASLILHGIPVEYQSVAYAIGPQGAQVYLKSYTW